MDRLPAVNAAIVLAALGALGACEERGRPPPSSRVNVVKAKPRKPVSLAGFCDVLDEGPSARRFELPPLAGKAPPHARSGWRWINVWATWCKPCVAEMPMIKKWHRRLVDAGKKIELLFLSVDRTEKAIRAFRRKHPEVPPSLRVKAPERLEPWVLSLGLDAAATIPINAFITPGGKTRCARSGGVRETDYRAVERLVSAR